MIEQDIEALDACELSRDVRHHVALVLRDSVIMHYEFLPAVMRLLNNVSKDGDVELVDQIITSNMQDKA